MHPVVQEGVIAGRYRSKENDREQEPAEGIAGPTGRQQGTHHCPRQEKAEPGPVAEQGARLMGAEVKRHIGQAEPEHAERDRRDRRHPPRPQDRAHRDTRPLGPSDRNELTLRADRPETVTADALDAVTASWLAEAEDCCVRTGAMPNEP